MLTKKQFDILDAINESGKKLSQRKIAESVNLSVGTVNKVLSELTSLEYIENGVITEKGLNALEPYRVKKAVIIAAGFGSRMVPITLNTPKPLVRVKGKRIIDSILEALYLADIKEIYIVRGYLKEQFDQLLYKFPTIKFIENDMFNEANNISSIYLAREHLENAYILEADLLLDNKALVKKYQYQTNYLTKPVESTNDWCFITNENGSVVKMGIGGENCHQLCGISYWTEKDGKQLAIDVEKVFNSFGGKERYWDQVPCEICMDNYVVYVRDCKEGDIIEIDTFKELVAIDPSYEIKG